MEKPHEEEISQFYNGLGITVLSGAVVDQLKQFRKENFNDYDHAVQGYHKIFQILKEVTLVGLPQHKEHKDISIEEIKNKPRYYETPLIKLRDGTFLDAVYALYYFFSVHCTPTTYADAIDQITDEAINQLSKDDKIKFSEKATALRAFLDKVKNKVIQSKRYKTVLINPGSGLSYYKSVSGIELLEDNEEVNGRQDIKRFSDHPRIKAFLKDDTEPDKIETENQQQSDNLFTPNTTPHIPSSSLTDSFNNSEIIQPTSPQSLINKRDPIRFKRDTSIHDPFDDSNVPYQGRQEQFQLLEKFAEDKENLRIWAISGPSGCGKTRLMREWLVTSKNLQEWDQLVLEQKDNDSKKWEDWNPEYNTIFVIDYLYGFMETLKTIMDRCREVCHIHTDFKIRILILDHVFPQNLQELEKKITSAFGVKETKSSHRYSDLFFEKTPIHLETTDDQNSIIENVLKHAAGTDVEDAECQTALEFLQKMEGAWHPLFAVLIGNTLKDSRTKGESLNSLKWSRRDLIEHYLAGTDRLPWENSNNTHNIWASAFVAISTARRGMAFETLRHCVPVDEVILNAINFPDIRSGCEKIMSVNKIPDHVPPYIPDILGESFFLRFVEDLQAGYAQLHAVEKPFYHMLFCGDDDTLAKDAVLFIEFIQRLTRNLCNDAQDEKVVQNHWKALCHFLKPETLNIPLSSPMALAVSAALFESTKIIEKHNPEKLADLKKHMFKQIDFQALCYPHENHDILRKSVEYAMTYYEQITGSDNNTKSLEIDLIELLQYYGGVQKQRDNWTALMIASHFRCPTVVKLLFEKKLVQINATQIERWTALMVASYQGYTDIVEELLNKEANPNMQYKDKNDWTALMAASRYGYTETVKELLAQGADPNLQNKDGLTALILASEYGHTDIVKELLTQEANLDLQNRDGVTALIFASRDGHTEIVKELLAHNANPDLQNKNKWTALMMASYQGYTDIVKELLTYNVNLVLQTKKGWTALMIALSKNHYDIIELLLEKDAPLKTGLHYHWHDIMTVDIDRCKHIDTLAGSHFNSFAIVENAVDYPWKPLSQEQIESLKTAKIFFKDENHWMTPCVTSMILPWYQEQVSLIRIRDTDAIQNPLTLYCIEYKNHYFRFTGESALLHYLRQSASFKLTGNTALDYLRFFCFFVRIEDRAFNIIDPDTCHWKNNFILPENQFLSSSKIISIDEQGNYACEAPISYGFYLFQAQFRVYNDGTVDMLSDNPLQEALCRLEDEMLVSSNLIFTPLIAACQAGYKEVVKQLLEDGADIAVIDHEGKTALSYAQEGGYTEIVEMLREAEAKKDRGL